MKLTSRSHNRFVRRSFPPGFKQLLAIAGLLTLHESGQSQNNINGNAETNAPAVATPAASAESSTANPAKLLIKKPRRDQISVSGDYSIEQGKITMPIGYSLKSSLQGISAPTPLVATPKRSSDYYGGTLSYSYGRTWFLDLSYAQGTSTGTQGLPASSLGGSPTGNFTLDDDWYQAYVRYSPLWLSGGKWTGYARLGGTYVDSKLTYDSTSPSTVQGIYHQTDNTTDIYGNVGLGATYALHHWGHFRIGLQAEMEAFGGERSQDSLETLYNDIGLTPVTAHISNTVFGGIGRGTVHMEYQLGSSGACRMFLDGGIQYQYSEISYPGLGNQSETLWGPYVKLGFSYSF